MRQDQQVYNFALKLHFNKMRPRLGASSRPPLELFARENRLLVPAQTWCKVTSCLSAQGVRRELDLQKGQSGGGECEGGRAQVNRGPPSCLGSGLPRALSAFRSRLVVLFS